jgi:spore coat protein H
LTLPVYKIEISQENLDALNSNPTDDAYFPATFNFDTLSYSCEVRYRGSTSRELPKKSWKISFKDKQTFFEAEKLNLNAEYRDKSSLTSTYFGLVIT